MKLVVIDCGSGNLRSVAKAVERAAREADIAADIEVSAEPARLRQAERIILPGVGAFAECGRGLRHIPGMMEALEEAVTKDGKPFLGICVGMQLMADIGREHGDYPGLGWLGGEIIPLTPADSALKIPHMGWNQLEFRRDHPLLAGIVPGAHGYFVHGYHFQPADPSVIIAETTYGGRVVAMVGRDNLVGTQFHPEKSQAVGLRLLGNFLGWQA